MGSGGDDEWCGGRPILVVLQQLLSAQIAHLNRRRMPSKKMEMGKQISLQTEIPVFCFLELLCV